MTLSWDPPLNNGGSTIQGYWLEKRERGAVYWGRVNRAPVTRPSVKGLQYTVLKLIEGSEYQFRIAASNAAGVGPPSESSECRFALDPSSECSRRIGVDRLALYLPHGLKLFKSNVAYRGHNTLNNIRM